MWSLVVRKGRTMKCLLFTQSLVLASSSTFCPISKSSRSCSIHNHLPISNLSSVSPSLSLSSYFLSLTNVFSGIFPQPNCELFGLRLLFEVRKRNESWVGSKHAKPGIHIVPYAARSRRDR